MIKLKDSNGFTILELMIATVILATLLLLCATVAVQIGKVFYKGVSSSRTQEASRDITSQISRDIQFSGTIPQEVAPTIEAVTMKTVGAYCVGSTRYSYRLDAQVNGSTQALVVDKDPTGCTATYWTQPSSDNSARELVPNRMRLSKFQLKRQDPLNDNLWNLDVGIALGDDDLFNRTAGVIVNCVGVNQGGQFCDVSELNTAIYRRLQ